MDIKLSISTLARDKEGNKVDPYSFNYSFRQVNFTEDELVNHLAIEGYTICANHRSDPPAPDSRWKTPRNSGNFESAQLILLDDDTGTPDVEEFWLNDPFFQEYGYMIYHSASSTPEGQKVRVVFIIEDEVVTSADHLKSINQAFRFFYGDRTDSVCDAIRVYYGSQNCKHAVNGKYLPFGVIRNEILKPYRLYKDIMKATQELERENRRRFILENGSAQNLGTPDVPYLRSKIRGMVKYVGNAEEGTNRNSLLFWFACKIGELSATDWALNIFDEAVEGLQSAVVWACNKNGYIPKYAKNDAEVIRIFNAGFSTGAQNGGQWDNPSLDQWFIFSAGQRVFVNNNGVSYPAIVASVARERLSDTGKYQVVYRMVDDNRLYGEFQLSPAEMTSLDQVSPALTPEQKSQVEHLLHSELWKHYMLDANRSTLWNKDDVLLDMLQLGAKGTDLTIPMQNGEGVVNVEYRGDDGIQYENDEQGYFQTDLVEDTPRLWTLESLATVDLWLQSGESLVNNDGSKFTFRAMSHLPIDMDHFAENDVILLEPENTISDRAIWRLKDKGVRVSKLPIPLGSEFLDNDLLNRLISVARVI